LLPLLILRIKAVTIVLDSMTVVIGKRPYVVHKKVWQSSKKPICRGLRMNNKKMHIIDSD